MTAPGRYIPAGQRMAAFASMLLPEAERNELRARKACATEVLERFEIHHVVFHAWTKENRWWNLDPQLKADHRKRTQVDIALIAKSKRLKRAEELHGAAMTGKAGYGQALRGIAERGIARQGSAGQGNARKLPSRPFPKGRKLRGKK